VGPLNGKGGDLKTPWLTITTFDFHLADFSAVLLADVEPIEKLGFAGENIRAMEARHPQQYIVEKDDPLLRVDNNETVGELFDDSQQEIGHARFFLCSLAILFLLCRGQNDVSTVLVMCQ
jgi:hypothetical protein